MPLEDTPRHSFLEAPSLHRVWGPLDLHLVVETISFHVHERAKPCLCPLSGLWAGPRTLSTAAPPRSPWPWLAALPLQVPAGHTAVLSLIGNATHQGQRATEFSYGRGECTVGQEASLLPAFIREWRVKSSWPLHSSDRQVTSNFYLLINRQMKTLQGRCCYSAWASIWHLLKWRLSIAEVET